MAIGIRQPAGGGRGPEGSPLWGQAFALAGASALVAAAGHYLDTMGVLHGHLADASFVPGFASIGRFMNVGLRNKKDPFSEVVFSLVLGTGLEAAQVTHFMGVSGTFDILDTVAYGVGAAGYLGLSRYITHKIPDR